VSNPHPLPAKPALRASPLGHVQQRTDRYLPTGPAPSVSSGLPYWFVFYMMIIAPIMIGCTVAYCQDRAFRRKVTGFLVLAGMVSLIRAKKQLRRARDWAHGLQPEDARLAAPSKWAVHDDTTRLPSRLSLSEMGAPARRDSPSSSIASGRSTPVMKRPSPLSVQKDALEVQPQCQCVLM